MGNFFKVEMTEEIFDRMLSIVNCAFDAVSDEFNLTCWFSCLFFFKDLRDTYTKVILDIVTAVFWKPGSKIRSPFLTLLEMSDSSPAHIC